MIPKKSLDSVLDKSIILTITAPNDNAKSISVQCGGGVDYAHYNTTCPPDLSSYGPGAMFGGLPKK